MPDDRLFHKRLGHSEKVATLTDFEYVVWTAYVLSADDFGVMRFSAISLQADHDRLAVKPAKAVQRAMDRVRDVGLIHTFAHQGRVYALQGDWQDWQHVDYPRATINPKPDETALLRCSEATRKLFEHHPGGWRGKRRNLSRVSETPLEGIAEGVPKVSDTPHPKPLAVSRKPVAVSRESDHAPADVDRVRAFIDRYRELHEQYIGVAYLGNPQTDYHEACKLVATFDDAMLEKLIVYWLNDRDKFANEGTRTIAKLRSRASKYAEELKAKRLA